MSLQELHCPPEQLPLGPQETPQDPQLFGSDDRSFLLTLTPDLVSETATVTVGPETVFPFWVLLSE
jgi:hypothetical protein